MSLQEAFSIDFRATVKANRKRKAKAAKDAERTKRARIEEKEQQELERSFVSMPASPTLTETEQPSSADIITTPATITTTTSATVQEYIPGSVPPGIDNLNLNVREVFEIWISHNLDVPRLRRCMPGHDRMLVITNKTLKRFNGFVDKIVNEFLYKPVDPGYVPTQRFSFKKASMRDKFIDMIKANYPNHTPSKEFLFSKKITTNYNSRSKNMKTMGETLRESLMPPYQNLDVLVSAASTSAVLRSEENTESVRNSFFSFSFFLTHNLSHFFRMTKKKTKKKKMPLTMITMMFQSPNHQAVLKSGMS